MIIGVRNLSADNKSGEVWVNELRLKDYNNKGGWAANGNLNVQLSDLGNVNVQGKYVSDGFGGLEDGVMQRSQEDFSTYSVTTNVELGKFFPDKAKVTAPLYYSVTKEKNKPRYNPLDTDMKLDDALGSAATKSAFRSESIRGQPRGERAYLETVADSRDLRKKKMVRDYASKERRKEKEDSEESKTASRRQSNGTLTTVSGGRQSSAESTRTTTRRCMRIDNCYS
jgi:cell surface protein SprA